MSILLQFLTGLSSSARATLDFVIWEWVRSITGNLATYDRTAKICSLSLPYRGGDSVFHLFSVIHFIHRTVYWSQKLFVQKVHGNNVNEHVNEQTDCEHCFFSVAAASNYRFMGLYLSLCASEGWCLCSYQSSAIDGTYFAQLRCQLLFSMNILSPLNGYV